MKRLIYLLFSALILILGPFSKAQKKMEVQKSILKVGMSAPNFTLEDAHGNHYTLSSFRGRMPVIVYFYPKAGTAGCTKEACGIRDDWGKFKKNKIQVLGISVDTKKEILKFIKDNSLNFPLLSDASTKVSKEYGVYNNQGYDNRITFIINKKGKINNIINVKNIEEHAEEVFKIASKL